MNTLQEQGSFTPVDEHGHVCDFCNTSFTHFKSRIRKGFSHEAHECPLCGKPVNTRVELTVFNGKPFIRPDFVDYYGPSDVGFGGLPGHSVDPEVK